ncbi:MAG: SUMF1/EgtB/PvdO family nonheme iron enzyme, partial [Kiritimatiellae bacterium]|nr:SUMF1/EgtB/PvdO family nonheme iron enzyme [Kiritimatiellia bacterium]
MKQFVIMGLQIFVISMFPCFSNATFIVIGDAGNAADGSTGYGEVGYEYRISEHEVAIAEFAAAVSNDSRIGSGNENWWNDGTRTVGDNAPVVYVSWYEAAKYCNWLTTRDAYTGAYQFDGSGALTNVLTRAQILASHDRYYVLPTEDEWYKAAYYTGNSSDYWSFYAHGTDSAPLIGTANGWNYYGSAYLNPAPNYTWEVSYGGVEQNGTRNMMGNVWEWIESAYDGTLNNLAENRVARGGSFGWGLYSLDNTWRNEYAPTVNSQNIGFRIVVIHAPHPSTIDPENQYAYGANIG